MGNGLSLSITDYRSAYRSPTTYYFFTSHILTLPHSHALPLHTPYHMTFRPVNITE